MGLFKNMKDSMKGAQDVTRQAMANAQTQQGKDLMSAGLTMPSAGDRDAVMAQGNEYKRLMQVGLTGNAVITSAADSGERAAGNTVASLELQVTPDGGDAYPVSLRYIIGGSDLGPYAPGSSYPVRIDPENRQNVTFG